MVVIGDERPEVAQNVCTFTIIGTNSLVNKLLETCCLGLISDINDMLLQDVQGKKSVTAMRKILGALVSGVGSAVYNFSPQIHSPRIHPDSGILPELETYQR